jgi:colanic acid/amylovoran biosynthesis glycosyltransferase
MRVGLDLGKFPFRERRQRSDSDPIRLITVARLIELKGHEFALRAVALLRQKHRNLSYDIVGDGPLRSHLERLSIELGLQGVLRWHGARAGAFIEDLMAEAHIGLLASVSIEGDAEGQGLFVQEAQACGLPVVVTQHGALPEGLVPDGSGFVVPERDPVRLAERLDYLVENPGRWGEMGRTGVAFVASRYDIRQLTGQLVDLYRSARATFRNGRQT